MKVRHPRAHPDVPGKPPAKIDTADGVRELDDDGVFGHGEGFARELADRYGVPFDVVDASVPVSAVSVDAESADETDAGFGEGDASSSDETSEDAPTTAEEIDAGVCPWCDDYEGSGVAQHASSAHPDEWAAYKDG